MGGNAFTKENHGFITSRMTRTQYDQVLEIILPFLREYFRIVSVAPEAPGKVSYGDVDVMVAQSLRPAPYDSLLQDATQALGLKCKGIIYNNPTTNLAVAIDDLIVQVDVHIVSRDDLWDLDYWFHSYGDMAMIVSSTVKPSGLRLSSTRGLWIEIPGHGPFGLSVNIEQILRFFQLDWERYCSGFETVVDIFEWIDSMKLNGERIGIKSRGKMIKTHEDRKMWKEYWIRGEDAEYRPSEDEKAKILQQALEYFNKKKEYSETCERLLLERITKEKLNGNKVMEWTGARGKRLGDILKVLRQDERLSSNALLEMDDERIKDVVMEYWRDMCA